MLDDTQGLDEATPNLDSYIGFGASHMVHLHLTYVLSSQFLGGAQ